MTYTDDQVFQALKDAVSKMGEDYVYVPTDENCAYGVGYDPQPSCIVGHVIYALDKDAFKRVVEYEREEFMKLNPNTGIFNVANNLNLDFTRKQARALQQCQFWQDNGENWKEALFVYEEEMHIYVDA